MKRGSIAVAVGLCAALLVGCGGQEPADPTESTMSLVDDPSDEALDELFVAVDATRAQSTGRYTTESPQRTTTGAYDGNGVSVRSDGRPEIRVVGSQAYLPSTLFPRVAATTTWLSVPLDDLAPLENRSPGLADEIAALAGAAPPGLGPSLAALRTSTGAHRNDDGTILTQLNLSNLGGVNPRDQDAVVAWAGLWARDGGPRTVVAEVSIASDGLLQQVVIDPDGETDAGPLTLALSDLGDPVTVNTPFASDVTVLR